jgi:RNA polymerase sigma-70 factor, ECF subfamily
MPESDGSLVARARRGESAAFEALVRRHLRAAYAVALAVLASPADAEDVAQDAFVVAFERLEECREPERFTGWLLQIVRNRARNARAYIALRQPEAVQDSEDEVAAEGEVDSAPAGDERVDLRKRLIRALSSLPERQREVVLLHDLEGWTHAEIASALELSELSSRQTLFVARRALREQLGHDFPQEAHHE